MVAVTALIHYSSGGSIDSLLILWACAPYIVLLIVTLLADRRRTLVLAFWSIVVIAGLGTVIYIEGILIHPDPQNALGFYFVPAVQLACAVLMAVLVIVFRSRHLPNPAN